MAKLTEGWHEVFRAGKHTSSNGQAKDWTEKDLDKIVEKYNPDFHEAPIVTGHPKDNDPAFGWVEEVKREGKSLKVKFKQVADEFQEWIDKGLYKKVSVSISPEYGLRHVGFLGAIPPAIKGLNYQFKEDINEEIYEFADFEQNLNWKFRDIGDVVGRIRDFFIEKYGLEEADRVIGSWSSKYIGEKLQEDIVNYKETEENTLSLKDLFAKFKGEKAEFQEFESEVKNAITPILKKEIESEFAEKMKEKDAKIAKLEADAKKQEIEKRKVDFKEFAEKLHKEGKLVSDKINTVIDFMEAFNGIGEFEFSEGEENKKENALEKFKNFMESMPELTKDGEFCTNNQIDKNFSESPEITEGSEIAKALD